MTSLLYFKRILQQDDGAVNAKTAYQGILAAILPELQR